MNAMKIRRASRYLTGEHSRNIPPHQFLARRKNLELLASRQRRRLEAKLASLFAFLKPFPGLLN